MNLVPHSRALISHRVVIYKMHVMSMTFEEASFVLQHNSFPSLLYHLEPKQQSHQTHSLIKVTHKKVKFTDIHSKKATHFSSTVIPPIIFQKEGSSHLSTDNICKL